MNIMPDIFATTGSRKKLMAILRTFFLRKGLNLQINSVSAELLEEAREHPEEYAGLMVRISGYNDYFTMLTPELQEEIISRTAHSL
jgi:formate C-acetyltransferase